jgi:hypothetical protein
MNHLFVIGINQYSDHQSLNNCVTDVQDFKEILIDKYDFDASRVTEIYDDEATSRNIQDALGAYVKTLTPETNLIIYFSGHGWYDEKTDRGFWVPHNATKDYSTFIPNEVILSLIQKIKAKHIFLISDCCFSWSILIKDLPKVISEYSDSPSRWALTSGKFVTWDSIEKGTNSVFAESILKCLRDSTDNLRTGKLIEFVKNEIGSNPRQTPQGFALADSNNKGGEFIFKLKDVDIDLNKTFKVHSSAIRILQFWKRSSKFKEMFRVEKGKSKNQIGYVIFLEKDAVTRKDYFLLFLYQGIHLTDTLADIKLNYPQIFQLNNLIVFLPKEKEQTIYKRRLSNISRELKPLNIYYIDEFIRDFCTPKNDTSVGQEEKYILPNFVLPKFEIEDIKYDDPTFFKNWLVKDDEPILIIKGGGGIGKTTFAQFIANLFKDLNNDCEVIFIDSLEVKNELTKREYKGINIYSFYEAAQSNLGKFYEMLSEDLFKLNLDAGNFLLIIDGLDEVISKVAKFDVDEFLNSIVEYSSEMGNAKVIITCRSHFWESKKFSDNQILTVDLLPFNQQQTLNFFNKCFNTEIKKVERGLKLSEEFQLPDDFGNSYSHPYILDVIRTIVDSNNEVLTYQSSFSSEILQSHIKSDYIIYRICYRERHYKDKIRILPLTVDEQVRFFSYWSIKKRGVISIANFGEEIKAALNMQHINQGIVEAFKSHPFIQTNRNSIYFKYDFFADYFKSIYVSKIIKIDSEILNVTGDFINILSENCWFGSSMVTDIANRITVWSEDEILKCSYLLNQIIKNDISDKVLKKKAISGLFNVCLAINNKFKQNNILQNTELIRSLFGKANTIEGAHIVNINEYQQSIRFDFCDTILIDCWIENFQSFWDCNFNEGTFFINCDLLNLGYDSEKRIPVPKENFQNCNTDESFDNAYNVDKRVLEKTEERIRHQLVSFFNFFHRNGKFEAQNFEVSYKGYDTIKLKFSRINPKVCGLKDLLEVCEEAEAIVWESLRGGVRTIRLSDSFKQDASSLIKDGTVTPQINSLIVKLMEKMSK